MAKVITRDVEGNLLPQYCNIRVTQNGTVTQDFSMTVHEAAEDAFHTHNRLNGLAKVEWRGAHIGHEWVDVTEYYLSAYNRLTEGN